MLTFYEWSFETLAKLRDILPDVLTMAILDMRSVLARKADFTLAFIDRLTNRSDQLTGTTWSDVT